VYNRIGGKMKIKLLGILIGIMLLSPVFVMARPQEKISQQSNISTPAAASSGIDVPVWSLNDKWTYQISDIIIDFASDTQSVYLYLTLSALPLTVTDTTGDFYTLSFTTTMSGSGYVYTNQGDGPINISIDFTDVTVTGTVQIEKSTLGVSQLTIVLNKQKFNFDIIQQPYIQLPSWLHKIPARITANAVVVCDTPFTLLTFPLETGMLWDSIATNVSLNGNVECGWFYLIKILNELAKLIQHPFLPDEIDALLPIVDIHDALTTLGMTNMFQLPTIPFAFFCQNTTESITVPAGTYDAYNISLLGGVGSCYYAPSVKNVIKLSGDFEELIPFVKNINMELLSSSYS
jgi:hypothetical protein